MFIAGGLTVWTGVVAVGAVGMVTTAIILTSKMAG